MSGAVEGQSVEERADIRPRLTVRPDKTPLGLPGEFTLRQILRDLDDAVRHFPMVKDWELLEASDEVLVFVSPEGLET